ncbi:MAG: CHAT domain-containing protein [Pseudomonadota bacterium]|nr:CHAT domain-containing protein [Pseudomonadota bacterium]
MHSLPRSMFFRCFLFALCLHAPLAWSDSQDIKALLQESLDFIQSGRPVEAEPLARQAISVAEALPAGRPGKQRERLLPTAQQRLGIALRHQGRFIEAESLLREALIGAERGHGYASRLAIKTQKNLGLALQAQGRYADADRQLREAVARAPAPKDDETLDAWLDVRASLGRLQADVGNYAEAESLLTTVWEKSAGATELQARRWRQHAADGLAMLRHRQGRQAEGEPYARAAAELAPVVWGARHAVTMNAYTSLGLTLFKLERLDEAESWLRRAAEIAESLSGQDLGVSSKPFRVLAQVLEQKGALTQDKQLLAQAEAMYKRAMSAADQGAKAEILLYTLRAQGRFLSQQGKPEAASPLYERAVNLADRMFALSRGLDEAARENKVALLRPIYGEAIHNWVRLDEKHPGKGHDRAALADVSRTQSRLFTEMLRTADVARLAGDDAFVKLKARRDDMLARLDELNRRFTLTARIDANGEDVQPARPIDDPFILERWKKDMLAQRRALNQAESERAEVEARLWRDYPRYMELEEPRPVTVDDLQRNVLRPNETLLAYFRLRKQLLVFLVSRDDFQLVRVPVEREELDRLVAQARQPMEAGGRLDALAQLDPAVLNRLYTLLLKPVQDKLPAGRRLLVVGDGPLYTLPLEMLVTRWGESDKKAYAAASKADLAQYGSLDYAGAHWRFSYLPSLASLAIQRAAADKPRSKAFSQNLLAFADPVFESADASPTAATRALLDELGATRGGRVSIPRLPETADEVAAVAKILGGEHSLYLRDAAQESRVKRSDLAHARYLHFATHGLLGGEFAQMKGYAGQSDEGDLGTRNISIVDDDENAAVKPPLKGQPALVLTLVGDLAGEDGLLTMNEVMGLKMNADLVVLSACNTAGERVEARNGEGFAGLTRAFMHAGARGLLVSHWSVESLATRDLITDFFRRQKAGAATPDALAAAQADIRSSRDERLQLSRAHPFFWAPFVHVGD